MARKKGWRFAPDGVKRKEAERAIDQEQVWVSTISAALKHEPDDAGCRSGEVPVGVNSRMIREANRVLNEQYGLRLVISPPSAPGHKRTFRIVPLERQT